LLKTKKIGVALVVLHNKQHLAALIATPQALVLNTLRWATEVRSADDLDLPEEGMKGVAIKPKELQMATQLIESMTEEWQPEEYKDSFRNDIMAMVKRKYDEGLADQITDVKIELPEETTKELDLTELLRQSLQGTAHRTRKTETTKKAPPPAARKSASRARPSKTVH